MFDPGRDPVRPGLVSAIDRTWAEIGSPGSWWDADERVAIAAAVRTAGDRIDAAVDLPPAAVDVIDRIATAPGTTSEEWVAAATENLGELRYIELVGVVARVVAVDTFTRLLGRQPIPLPDAVPGPPTQEPPPDDLRRNRTWVSMAMPVPPFVLGAVPSAMAAMNALCDELYMPPAEMGDPAWQHRALHRAQMELVAATTSHENECFY